MHSGEFCRQFTMHKTTGIVLRPVKYGETSVIVTIFTDLFGVQAYMIKGIRSQKATGNKAGLIQPGMPLDMVVYHYPHKSIQHIKEFNAHIIYQAIQEDVVKNTILLFSVEVLLRLLPENAPLPDLFDFALGYFKELDRTPQSMVGNFPLYFIIACSRDMGYELKGSYSNETPFLNLEDGGYTAYAPATMQLITNEDGAALQQLLTVQDTNDLYLIEMSAATRARLLEWYIAFLQTHSQHMDNIRSISILHAILH
ncbi:MAG: DNA repair protein RecO [Taibaiella sp.]|nr:DNA repair protein RecO [Taibaiella sp.]